MSLENAEKFETLIEGKQKFAKNRWAPTTVSVFSTYLKENNSINLKACEIKNISYSLQYLQFLQLELDSLTLHNVVQKLTWKTYIITSMSIIEVLFHAIVRNNNMLKYQEWNETTLETNEIIQDNKQKKCKIILQEKMDKPIEMEMKFQTLIDIVEKHRLIQFRTKAYNDLRKLKTIRNKVHLEIKDMIDSDYYTMKQCYYYFSRRYLFYILTNKSICSNQTKIFDFLKLSDEEKSMIEEYLIDMETL